LGPTSPPKQIEIENVIPEAFDPNQTLLTIKLSKDPDWETRPLVVTIAGQVFGLRDSPLRDRKSGEISLLVPTNLLTATRRVGVRRLFWGDTYADDFPLLLVNDFSVTGISLVSKTKDVSTFLLVGSRLDGVCVSAPSGIQLQLVPGSKTAATFTMTNSDLPNIKQLVLQKGAGQPIPIAMPKTDPPKPSLKDHGAVIAGKGVKVTLEGTLLDGLDRVVAEDGTRIYFKPAPDGKSVMLNLPDSLTEEPTVLALTFHFKDDSKLNCTLGVSGP
jgi:hypothetical protein